MKLKYTYKVVKDFYLSGDRIVRPHDKKEAHQYNYYNLGARFMDYTPEAKITAKLVRYGYLELLTCVEWRT